MFSLEKGLYEEATIDRIKIKLPHGEKIKRKLRENRRILIYGIIYKIPKNINLNSIIDYNELEILTDFEDILILALKKASKSSELYVQIFDVDMIDLYNTDFKDDWRLTLDSLIEEANYVLSKYLTGGWSQNEDLNGKWGKKEQQQAKKDIKQLKIYINRFEMVSKLLKKNNKYKELAILESDIEDINYIIYPKQLHEEIIRMKPIQILNNDSIKTS